MNPAGRELKFRIPRRQADGVPGNNELRVVLSLRLQLDRLLGASDQTYEAASSLEHRIGAYCLRRTCDTLQFAGE